MRLAILAAFGESYCRENKGARYRLISHEPRPSLSLIPAPEVDKRPMTFRFIDAVQRLIPNFTKAEWTKLYEKVGTRLHLNQLQKVFVVLSDEDRLTSSGREFGAPASGSNSAPVVPATRGLRKRPADGGSTPAPTPAKSVRGRLH